MPKNLGQRGPQGSGSDEPEDDFHQPNPKNPVAGARPAVVIGLALVLLGIIALVVFPFLPVAFPGWTTPALIAAIVLGIAILFMQMPTKRNTHGDGAQV